MRHAGKINELSCASLQVIGCFGLFAMKTLVSRVNSAEQNGCPPVILENVLVHLRHDVARVVFGQMRIALHHLERLVP